ncbi:MAG: ABC transporter ATP-binding protein [Bacillota bacterium]
MQERIRVNHLSRKFGTVLAVDDVSFEIREHEFFSLLGPSGCGKTTTLRCIAGLEQPTAGEVYIGGVLVTSVADGVLVPPDKRAIGMVFQNYAVWPHMTVEQNISYPLKLARAPREEVKQRTDKVLEMLQLRGLGKRYPAELSGGQQQRVALGRALVTNPEVLLLDEPLSNLDAKLREQMRFELKDLQEKTGIAILYVTHDQIEAMAMSDRVAVMNNGIIVQEGKPHEIYQRPANKFVADFIGTMNFLQCQAIESHGDSVKVRLQSGDVVDVGYQGSIRGKCLLAVRPEDVVLSRESGLRCQVEVGIFLGSFTEYRVRVGNDALRVQTSIGAQFQPGETAFLQIEKGLLFQ